MAELDMDIRPEPEAPDLGGGQRLLLTRSQRAIADAVYDMAMAEQQQIEFVHSSFANVGLPRSAVEGRTFERRSGKASLLIEAGKLYDGENWIQQPVPYGPKPRMVMVHISTYATKYRTPEIPIGESFSEFMRMLGVTNINGGDRGSRTSYRKQIMALSAATIRLGVPTANGARTVTAQPISQFELWFSQREEGQRPLWPGVITLSSEYHESLIEHAFPVDGRALHAIGSSALAMDIYMWLASRLWRVGERPVMIHWPGLYAQFGQEFGELKDFKKKFRLYLLRALAVYPDAKVDVVSGGLLLRQSRPPVARAVKVALSKS